MRNDFPILLLFSTFITSIIAGKIQLFERQCAVPCGADCGLAGDTCCTTPAGNPNLCGYGTTCCLFGCCNFGSTCQPDGSCFPPNPTTTGDQGVPPTSNAGSPPPSSSGAGAPAPTSETAQPTQTQDVSTETLPDGVVVTSSAGILVFGTNTIIVPTGLASSTTVTTDGETFTFPPSQPTQVIGVSTEILPDGVVVTSSAGVLVFGTNTVTVPTGLTTPTIITTDGETFTFPPSQPTQVPGESTETLPDGVVVTSSAGVLVFGTNTVTIPEGLNSPTTIITDGETFTFQPTGAPSTTGSGFEVTETQPDGVVVTSSAGVLFWGTNTITMPTGLTAPETTTAFGEVFTFEPTGAPVSSGSGAEVTETLPDGVVVTSSAGILFWGTNTVTVPTGLTTDAIVTTDGETFTFSGSEAAATTAAATTTQTGALAVFTTWPDVVSIIPVATSVPGPESGPTIPCKVWFFFICISWNINIGGWQLVLPPGIYPPGPPPGLQFPPGFSIQGPLPPWPPITIGNDNVPTYSDEPTSCETETATIFLTTTSFGVSAKETTATQVLSTSSEIVGCDIQSAASTAVTTGGCPASATTCSEAAVITFLDDSSDPPITLDALEAGALATSVFNYVNGFWSDEDAAAYSTAMVTTALPTSALPTLPAPTTAAPTTLPIIASAGSSCVSTVTTSVCEIPQEPCEPSLSCASWTATAAASSTGGAAGGGSPTTAAGAPSPTATWYLTLYDATCEDQETETKFDYYALSGYGAQEIGETCFSLQHGLPLGSFTSESCEYFTDGGIDPGQACSAGSFTTPTSFVIRTGFCTVYTEDGCTGYSNGITSSQYKGCTDYDSVPVSDGLPQTWLSFQCFAEPAAT